MAIHIVTPPDPEKLAQITAEDNEFKSAPGYYHWSCVNCGASWTGMQKDQIIIRINKHLEDGIICPACKSKCGGGTLGDSDHAKSKYHDLTRQGEEVLRQRELERRIALGYKCYDCKGTGIGISENNDDYLFSSRKTPMPPLRKLPISCTVCEGYGWRG